VALAAATITLVILTPEMGAVQTTLGTLRALPGLGVAETTLRIVLNQVSPEAGLARSVVEKALGRPVDLAIPYDPPQTTALAQGMPLIFGQPTTPLAVAVGSFAAKL